MSTPEPTDCDRTNAAIRQAIADRQNHEYGEVLKLAMGVLGSGWTPWMKLVLLDSDHRRTGDTNPVAVVYKVYHGEKRKTERSVFLRRMPDGSVRQAGSYEELFGELLYEPHPTKTLEIKGKLVAAPRWELCWSALELYRPRSAEDLAALRVSRERGKAAREDRKFAEENPLLAHVGIRRQDVARERER
jgi:hypothetical protein